MNDVQECPEMSSLAQSSQLELPCLNDKHRAAIELLLRGKTYLATARALEIDVKTLQRWRRDQRFIHELARRREQLRSDAAERLRAMIHPALDVLEHQLQDDYDRARFRAANAVLRHTDLRKSIPPNRNRHEESE